MIYRIGTRGSKLALTQTKWVCRKLQEQYPQHQFEIVIIKTTGDRIQNEPLSQIGGKGIFVREIEERLQKSEVDIGVHSMKDMPVLPAESLIFTKAWKREDPRDVLILREAKSLQELKEHAVIGTGSARRGSQLLALRPDLKIVDIRGNIDTRIRKMKEEKMDGIVLAAAGLHRMGMREQITQYLEYEQMIPSPAQGILALEIRKEDTALQKMLDALSDEESEFSSLAERGVLQAFGGDCHTPLGAVCTKTDHGYCLRVVIGDPESQHLRYAMTEGCDAQRMVTQVMEQLGE